MKRKQTFITNTILLTAVTLMLRAVGVSFHVYIANKIGAAGMGLFSLIMSVYGFGVTFACSGIQLATTKLVSEELAIGAECGVRRAIKKSCIYALIFGGGAFLLIFFGAHFAGTIILNDTRTILALQILSLSLPCVALSSVASGYFNAVGRVYKSAVSQIVEQLLRVGGCVWLLSVFGTEHAQTACNMVVISGCAAEILSFILVFILLKVDIKRYQNKKIGGHITGRMLSIALPIAVSSYVRSGLSTLEHTMIPRGLRKYGGDAETALSAYGVVHGMVMPLIFFPSAVLQAFSTLLIPEISAYFKLGDAEKIQSFIERAFYMTLVFSIGASGILFFFAEEIGMFVYHSSDAALLLHRLAPLAAIMYLDGVVDAILKGLNQQVYSMGYNIADSVIAIILMLYLLPAKGINGYVLILYITEMVNAYLSINRLLKVAAFRIFPVRWTFLPAIAIFLSIYFVKSLGTFQTTEHAIFAICASIFLYAIIMFLFSCRRGQKRRLQNVFSYDVAD